MAGCAILESILDIWPAHRLGVADRGIREGILRSLISANGEGERMRAEVMRARREGAMTRSGGPPVKRLRKSKGRTQSSTTWLTRQLNDPYVAKARAAGYRSRAAFKLAELDEKFALLKGVTRVVDLGIAPGGWSQVVRQRCPRAAIAGIDLLPVDPIEGVTLFEMDFMADEAPAALAGALDGPPDLVLSDMAANTVGHKQTDHLRTMGLVEAAAHFAIETLAPGGAFVAKVLAGGTDAELLALLKRHFGSVKHAKPPASRKDSSEWYVIAQEFKGRGD